MQILACLLDTECLLGCLLMLTLCKQCRSRSDGFLRSQLIWIYTVCHSVCEFISTIWIKVIKIKVYKEKSGAYRDIDKFSYFLFEHEFF